MMRRTFLLTTCLYLSVAFIATAQTKRLDLEQSLGLRQSLTKPIDQIGGWADAQHFIAYDAQTRQRYQVDIKTGKRTAYAPSPSSSTEVYIQNDDIYIRTGNGAPTQLTNTPDAKERNPTLSPDNQYVAFTRNNDLYAIRVSDGLEIRYTNDGTDVIYNGWASWVYFEEILGRESHYKAFWWSPDSKRLAFMRFDDTEV